MRRWGALVLPLVLSCESFCDAFFYSSLCGSDGVVTGSLRMEDGRFWRVGADRPSGTQDTDDPHPLARCHTLTGSFDIRGVIRNGDVTNTLKTIGGGVRLEGAKYDGDKPLFSNVTRVSGVGVGLGPNEAATVDVYRMFENVEEMPDGLSIVDVPWQQVSRIVGFSKVRRTGTINLRAYIHQPELESLEYADSITYISTGPASFPNLQEMQGPTEIAGSVVQLPLARTLTAANVFFDGGEIVAPNIGLVGWLRIGGASVLDLRSVQDVGGALSISNTGLRDLSGLGNVTVVRGDLGVIDNQFLAPAAVQTWLEGIQVFGRTTVYANGEGL